MGKGFKPKLKVSFTERDLGMGHFLREAAKLRLKPFVKVGVTQKRGANLSTDGTKTIAYIAAVHEYGADKKVGKRHVKIPERSFIRSTVTRNQSKYDNHIEKLRDDIFDAHKEMTVERALGIVGQEVAADMKATIRAKIAPDLKPSTIFRKNAGVIAKSKAKVSSLEKKQKLSKTDKKMLDKHSEIVATGGESTPLIDKGQLINSISYEVVKDGTGDGVDAPEGEAK